VLTIGYDKSVRKLVRIMWIPVLVTALYTGWVLWQRHTAQASVPQQPMESDPLAKYGNRVTIAQFYSSNAAIAQGGKARLCYGVVNAKEVRLDPPADKVWPSLSRCFDVAPARTTHYTLTAEGADHKVVTKSLDVVVHR
jgi:hypothetical protein